MEYFYISCKYCGSSNVLSSARTDYCGDCKEILEEYP